MKFNRIQLLRNEPIKIERSEQDYMFIQCPTIGQTFSDEPLFMVLQILMMDEEKLKKFIDYKDTLAEKDQIINAILLNSNEKDILLKKFQEIIPGCYMNDEFLTYNKVEIGLDDYEKIKIILEIAMGQSKYKDFSEKDKELTPEEKRMMDLEKKIQEKKQKQSEKNEDVDNVLEDIMIAVGYEFGFDIEKMMNMNYFTLLWYYSYTNKIHVYRLNNFALSSGAVKKVNTDYFTNIK